MRDDMEATMSREELLDLTSQIVQSHVSHNMISPTDLPGFIEETYKNLERLAKGTPEEEVPTPAVPINRSSFRDRLVCLECGRSMKMLKRHLSAEHDLSPNEYIEKWGLPASYPMVTPVYAKQRSELARGIGLGQRGRPEEVAVEEVEEEEAPKRKGRTRKAASSRKASTSSAKKSSGSSRSTSSRGKTGSARGRKPAEDFEEDAPAERQAAADEEVREYQASAADDSKVIREPDDERYETLDDFEEIVEDYQPDGR